nr:hypothetical protein [uncultured Flavobacterium sp.]
MKLLLIIFALLNLNYIYSQDRFSSNQFLYNSGLKYEPRSFEESMRIPMMYKQRADENYEKLRTLRKELYRIKEGIKFNQEKYHPTIDGIDEILYRLLTNSKTNFAHPDTDKIIRITTEYIDETIKQYNEDIRKYNEKQKYN